MEEEHNANARSLIVLSMEFADASILIQPSLMVFALLVKLKTITCQEKVSCQVKISVSVRIDLYGEKMENASAHPIICSWLTHAIDVSNMQTHSLLSRLESINAFVNLA